MQCFVTCGVPTVICPSSDSSACMLNGCAVWSVALALWKCNGLTPNALRW